MTFQLDWVNEWQNTVTRAVGATTRTGVRGTLPVLVPTDANSAWVAPNGSDAAAGTQAAPKLTVNGANAILAGARTNIQIFRNGYVGDLVIGVNANFTLGLALATASMQVSQGEIGYVVSSTATVRVITIPSSRSINGISFSSTIIFTNTATVSSTFANCTFLASGFTNTPTTPSIRFHYCYIRTTGDFFVGNDDNLTGVDFQNCIAVFPATTGGILLLNEDVATGNVSAPIFTRCLILGGTAYSVDQTTVIGVTVTFVSCALFPSNLVQTTDVTGAIVITLNFCREAWAVLADQTNSAASSVTATSTNEVAIGQPPLLTDQQGCIDGDPEGARLQIANKQTPQGNGVYWITSPLRGTGLASVDVAPWDETLVFASADYQTQVDLTIPPQSVTIASVPTNPVTIQDALGNSHTTHDGLRRRIKLTWGAGDYYNHADTIRILNQLLADTGTKRWFPRGITTAIWSGNGTFSVAPNIITVTGPLIPGNWRGWWLEDLATNLFYYISSNTGTILYITDKWNVGLPAVGVVEFAVRFLLVANDPSELQFIQERYTEFTKGGGWTESTDDQAFEWQGADITLLEVEDDEASE